MKTKSGKMSESSTGALKSGPAKGDGSPMGKKPPVDKGEKKKVGSPMKSKGKC